VFWFSLQILSETSLNPRRIQQDIIIDLHRSTSGYYFCLILNKLVFSEKTGKAWGQDRTSHRSIQLWADGWRDRQSRQM
jgi:hypothetical protein